MRHSQREAVIAFGQVGHSHGDVDAIDDGDVDDEGDTSTQRRGAILVPAGGCEVEDGEDGPIAAADTTLPAPAPLNNISQH
jgi:hypothetical protein